MQLMFVAIYIYVYEFLPIVMNIDKYWYNVNLQYNIYITQKSEQNLESGLVVPESNCDATSSASSSISAAKNKDIPTQAVKSSTSSVATSVTSSAATSNPSSVSTTGNNQSKPPVEEYSRYRYSLHRSNSSNSTSGNISSSINQVTNASPVVNPASTTATNSTPASTCKDKRPISPQSSESNTCPSEAKRQKEASPSDRVRNSFLYFWIIS